MGKLLDKIRNQRRPATPAGPSKANHSADWIYKKHLADQGLGEQPTDTPAPAAGAAPPGGIVETDEDRKRRLLGGTSVQI